MLVITREKMYYRQTVPIDVSAAQKAELGPLITKHDSTFVWKTADFLQITT